MDHPSRLTFKGLSVTSLCLVTPCNNNHLVYRVYTIYTVSTKCDYSLECGARQHGQPPPVVGPRPPLAITRTWLGCPLGPEQGTPNLLGGQSRNLIEVWGLLMYDEFSVFSINENNVNQLNKINPNNV